MGSRVTSVSCFELFVLDQRIIVNLTVRKMNTEYEKLVACFLLSISRLEHCDLVAEWASKLYKRLSFSADVSITITL